MAPGTTPKGKNNVQTSTITLNPSLKLPLPIFGQKPKDKTENSKEKKDTEEDSQESGRKSRNRCFNSHCTISKVNYKYYNLQHLKGVFKKHIKTCKQCNLSIQNYLKENNLKFPPTNTCQICCGLNMKKWLKFYSNGDRELWVCNVCEKKQEPSLLSKLFFCQTNIPRQIAVNLTPQPTPFPKKRKSLNDSSNSINKYEEEEEEEEINYANNRSQSRGGKKNEILSPPPKRKATASPSPTLLPPQKRLKTKRKSEEPIYSINNNNNTSNIVNNSPSTPTSNPSIDNISAFSLSTPKDSSDRVLFNNHLLAVKMEEIMELIKQQEVALKERPPVSETMKDANRKLLCEIKDLKLANQKLENRLEKCAQVAITTEKEFQEAKKSLPPSLKMLLGMLAKK